VDHQHVVQRHFARLQDDVGGLALVDLHRDLLAAGEEVVRVKRVDVRHERPVAAGHDAHIAVLHRARREGHPRGEDVRLAQSPVRRVLVPGDEAGAPRFLREEGRVPAQEIRPEDVLDSVEEDGMPHQLGKPREEEVRLDAIRAAERSAQVALDALEPLALVPRVIIREHPHGKVVAVPPVLLDRRCRKPLTHRSPPRNVPLFSASCLE
jgi:hypothetical protein